MATGIRPGRSHLNYLLSKNVFGARKLKIKKNDTPWYILLLTNFFFFGKTSKCSIVPSRLKVNFTNKNLLGQFSIRRFYEYYGKIQFESKYKILGCAI